MKKRQAQKKAGRTYVGTSGWVYKSWHNILYPPDMKKDFLTHYARHFGSVEINTSFYHLPLKSAFEKWRDETPDDFKFAVKMSRYITHIQKLKSVKMAIRRFFTRMTGAGDKALVVLVQLPPRLAYDSKLFKKFMADLNDVNKGHCPVALEPRHKSWFSDENLPEIRKLMKKYRYSLVLAQSSVFPMYDPDDPVNITSDFVYVRFHGPKEFAASKYGKKLLKPWAVRMKKWAAAGKTVCAYFNDDAHGYAVEDAKDLVELTK